MSSFPVSRAWPDLIPALGLFSLLCGLCSGTVAAAGVMGLYEAEAAVPDRSSASRQVAVGDCLSLVLIKLTGRRNIAEDARFAPLLARAQEYVRQYSYRQVRSAAPLSDGAPVSEWHLVTRFDEDALNQALRESGAPVWGRERPAVLVWLIVEQGRQKRLVQDGELPALRLSLERGAARRGITARFPLLDLEETTRIRPTDTGEGFKDAVLAASARYQADIVLTASLSSTLSGLWEGEWRSYRAARPAQRWRTEADLPELALEEGLDRLVDELAAEFTTTGLAGGLQDVEIIVEDVDTLTQYARTLRYLDSLSPVSEVQLREVRAGQLKLALAAHGGALALTRAISLGGVLEPVENADEARYRLLP